MRTGRVHVLLHSDLFARTHSHALSLRVALTREQLRELRHACVGALVTQACGMGRRRMQGWQQEMPGCWTAEMVYRRIGSAYVGAPVAKACRGGRMEGRLRGDASRYW